jgi:hypothetical protein
VAAGGAAGCAEVAEFVGGVAGFADDEAASAPEPAITGDEAAASAGLAAAAGAADAPPTEPTASTATASKALPDPTGESGWEAAVFRAAPTEGSSWPWAAAAEEADVADSPRRTGFAEPAA